VERRKNSRGPTRRNGGLGGSGDVQERGTHSKSSGEKGYAKNARATARTVSITYHTSNVQDGPAVVAEKEKGEGK